MGDLKLIPQTSTAVMYFTFYSKEYLYIMVVWPIYRKEGTFMNRLEREAGGEA